MEPAMPHPVRQLVPALALATLLSGGAHAASFQYDNVIYQWPEDARRSTNEDSVRLTLDDADFAIRIFRSARSPADLQAWLTGQMAALVEEDETVEAAFPVTEQRQGGITYAIGGQSVDGMLQMGFALVIGDRAQMIVLDYWGDDGETQLGAVVEKYVQPMLSSLQFVSAGAEPLLGPPEPGPYDGVWYAQAMGYGLNGIELDHRFLMLSPEGWFFEDVPEGVGTPGFDFVAALAARPDDAGTYRVADGVLRFAYADGSVEEQSLAAGDEGTLVIDDVEYLALAPVADGLVLDGVYSRSSYTQFGPGTGIVGGTYIASSFAFTADGHYTAGHFAGTSASFETAAGDHTGGFTTGSDNPDVAGTYRVEAGVLVLTDSSGTTERRSLVVIVDGMIAIDGSVYLRDD
jgi:hypothetical protein